MEWFFSIFFLVELAIRLGLIIHVIMRPRPVPVTLAWILLLVAIPIASILLYMLLGESRLGSRRARKYLEITRHIEERAVSIWRAGHTQWTATDQVQRHLAALGTRVSGMPPLRGNQLELIGDTPAFLDRLRADIDAATRHCHMVYYIWTLDKKATEVAEALIRAAQRGVACRVLVDGVGGRRFLFSDLADRMRASGVQVIEALPVRTWRLLLARVDLRNHRKIAVIDGKVAYAGSHNLSEASYSAPFTRKKGRWIDATVRIQGPAVQALQTVFLRDWYLDSEEELPALEGFLQPVADVSDEGCVVHVIPSGPGPEPTAIHHALLATLHAAQEEIVMTTPYFIPDDAMTAALEIAAGRGVAVTLVLPEDSDAPIVGTAARAHYDNLMFAGVRILHYTKGLLHSKTITVDRKIGVITSVNFDMRSFFLNFECSLFIYDDDFASVLRFLQTSYIEGSYELNLHDWMQRPAHQRFLQNLARLCSPLL